MSKLKFHVEAASALSRSAMIFVTVASAGVVWSDTWLARCRETASLEIMPARYVAIWQPRLKIGLDFLTLGMPADSAVPRHDQPSSRSTAERFFRQTTRKTSATTPFVRISRHVSLARIFVQRGGCADRAIKKKYTAGGTHRCDLLHFGHVRLLKNGTVATRSHQLNFWIRPPTDARRAGGVSRRGRLAGQLTDRLKRKAKRLLGSACAAAALTILTLLTL